MPATDATPDPHAEGWINGVSWNRATPYSVFARLLTLDPLPNKGRFLSNAVELNSAQLDAVVDCANPRARLAVVTNEYLDGAVLLRFLDDPDGEVRARVFYEASGYTLVRRVRLPKAALVRAAEDVDGRVRRAVALHWDLPMRELLSLTHDSDERVRKVAIDAAESREAHDTHDTTEWDTDGEDQDARRDPFAYTDVTVDGVVVADDPDLTAERRAELAESDRVEVRIAVSLRPELTDVERLAVRDTVHPYRHTTPWWIWAAYDDPDAMRRIAASAHPLMRRSAASAPRLPPDVVAALAADEDFYVRLTLAQHCADAPSELVLDMHANWDGVKWDSLRFHPAYPWHEVERLVGHPSWRVRWAAAMSPYLTPELATLLAEDEHEGVRGQAMFSRQLPLDVLIGYLEARPQGVAANPNLPWRVMHELLDRAGVPEFSPPWASALR